MFLLRALCRGIYRNVVNLRPQHPAVRPLIPTRASPLRGCFVRRYGDSLNYRMTPYSDFSYVCKCVGGGGGPKVDTICNQWGTTSGRTTKAIAVLSPLNRPSSSATSWKRR